MQSNTSLLTLKLSSIGSKQSTFEQAAGDEWAKYEQYLGGGKRPMGDSQHQRGMFILQDEPECLKTLVAGQVTSTVTDLDLSHNMIQVS